MILLLMMFSKVWFQDGSDPTWLLVDVGAGGQARSTKKPKGVGMLSAEPTEPRSGEHELQTEKLTLVLQPSIVARP